MKESQQTMMEHSEVKVKLLKLYIEKYLNILTRSKYVGNIHIYDLFCGEGIYENGGKGSPIIILEAIKKIYFENKTLGKNLEKYNCLFNDIDEAKLNKLSDEINKRKLHYSEIGELNIQKNDYQKILPKVSNEIDAFKNEKAFVFIDPYGYKDIKISDIKKLMKLGKSEVLLFLPTQFMFRFEENGTPACLIEFIDELMPIETWPSSETGLCFIDNLTDAFRSTMGTSYFVDSFVITRNKNQFFCLFFFTSHIYGFEKMLESKWSIDEEEGRGWKYNHEINLFSNTEKKPNTEKFEKKLIDFLQTKKTNSEIYYFTISSGHLTSHSTEILSKLQNEGRLEVTNNDGTKTRKSAFYIKYKYYKEESNKVNFILK